MKSLLRTVPLMNRLSNTYEEASLFRGIDADNLAHIEGRWNPIFEKRKLEAEASGESLAEINAEDSHWQWGRKSIAAIEDPLTFDIYVLECVGNTQAVMRVRKGGLKCQCRHPDHTREALIYLDFLSTAPWNRPKLVSEPIYKGCGRILVSTAVSLSIDEELKGRIGLHSLPNAEAFYRDQIGMTDFGPDKDCNGLRYFELPASNAAKMFTNT